MKRSTPYFFRENGWTIWLTAAQYRSLWAAFEERARDGCLEARLRMRGFGPPPRPETHKTKTKTTEP